MPRNITCNANISLSASASLTAYLQMFLTLKCTYSSAPVTKLYLRYKPHSAS